MKPILGFYHVCMINDWENIVREQLASMLSSNLYENTETIRVSCLGGIRDRDKLIGMLPNKFQIAFYGTEVQHCEIPILKKMQEVVRTRDSLVWYIHTKGVTSVHNAANWRRMMSYFVIDQYQSCITALHAGFNACGVEVRAKFNKQIFSDNLVRFHFSGNFWWSKSQHIATLPNIETEWIKFGRNRYVAEAFIGMNNQPNFYSFHNTCHDLKKRTTPEEVYKRRPKPLVITNKTDPMRHCKKGMKIL